MNKDYIILKKYYGENFAKLCRKLFPSILETEGLLSSIIISRFAKNKYLYDDIIKQNRINNFEEYINSLIDTEKKTISTNKTVKELFNEKGYDFYECKTERDIQSFKKYYKKGEALCTFQGGRLNRCYVFWAVKKDADKIEREEYPKRDDPYGTSVISIQFTKNGNILSIKNRYNHHVDNPDATFSNNLEEINEGLTNAFEKEYNLSINQNIKTNLSLFNYVLASDGKWYRYNYELNNIYYCHNNIIIDNGKKISFDKSRYLIIDYFIFDFKKKTIKLYDENLNDSFIDQFENISKIEELKNEKGKKIIIKSNNEKDIIIDINKFNRIIKLDNKNITKVGNNYLKYNNSIEEINIPNLKQVGDDFLAWNKSLKKLDFPNLEETGDSFISANTIIDEVNLSNLKETGHYFLMFNKSLTKLSLPKLESTGKGFLCDNIILEQLHIPKIKVLEDNSLCNNNNLSFLNCPELEIIKNCILYKHKKNIIVNLPKVEEIGSYFLPFNEEIISINLPNVKYIKNYFMKKSNKLKEINMPKVLEIGSYFLYNNIELKELSFPLLQKIGRECLYYNKKISTINLSNIEEIGDYSLYNNQYYNNIYYPTIKDNLYKQKEKSKIKKFLKKIKIIHFP